jgi:acetyl/propionyl-CoA carboxylase alpha subunit
MGLTQEQLVVRGHAIETRLYAEDPAEGFLPQTGEVLLFEPPGGPGVRVDTGITGGAMISLHYDPMIAKISTWAEDRDAARRRMVQALRETVLLGMNSNLSYLKVICEHPAYAAGHTHTGFLEENLGGWRPPSLELHRTGRGEVPSREAALLAAAAAVFAGRAGEAGASPGAGGASGASTPGDGPGPWGRLGPLRLGVAGGWGASGGNSAKQPGKEKR